MIRAWRRWGGVFVELASALPLVIAACVVVSEMIWASAGPRVDRDETGRFVAATLWLGFAAFLLVREIALLVESAIERPARRRPALSAEQQWQESIPLIVSLAVGAVLSIAVLLVVVRTTRDTRALVFVAVYVDLATRRVLRPYLRRFPEPGTTIVTSPNSLRIMVLVIAGSVSSAMVQFGTASLGSGRFAQLEADMSAIGIGLLVPVIMTFGRYALTMFVTATRAVDRMDRVPLDDDESLHGVARPRFAEVMMRWPADGVRPRGLELDALGFATILGSRDATIDGTDHRSPEETFVASVAASYRLAYLGLCAREGIVVGAYVDRASGRIERGDDGRERFTSVVLRPEIRVDRGSRGRAAALHAEARTACVVANSVSVALTIDPFVVEAAGTEGLPESGPAGNRT